MVAERDLVQRRHFKFCKLFFYFINVLFFIFPLVPSPDESESRVRSIHEAAK